MLNEIRMFYIYIFFKFIIIIIIIIIFGLLMQHVGSWFPNQESNPYPL